MVAKSYSYSRKMVLGKRIAYLRSEKKHLTQKEFAEDFSEYIGRPRQIAISTVSAWETGRKIPSNTLLSGIADYFGVAMDFLLGRVDSEDNIGDTQVSKEASSSDYYVGYKIDKNELSIYDGKPVFVVFRTLEHPSQWGILDLEKNRVVFKSFFLNINESFGINFDLHSMQTVENSSFETNIRPYTMNNLMAASMVYVKILSYDDSLRARYNGWYKHTPNRDGLINATGHVLPYEGLGISYNAYNPEIRSI